MIQNIAYSIWFRIAVKTLRAKPIALEKMASWILAQ